jgi:hypothetical protein
MKMGSGTGPCGRCSVAARARVVCEWRKLSLAIGGAFAQGFEVCFGERIRTEHFASSSYLRAEVVAGGTMLVSSSSEGIGEGFK